MRTVKKGDSIRKSVTARWFNEQNKVRQTPLPPARTPLPENPVKLICVADSSFTFDRFDPATLVSPILEYETPGATLEPSQYSTVGCLISPTLTVNEWGIVQGPCNNATSSKITMLGVTWARFNLQNADDTHVTVVSGQLVSAASGEALIISPPPGTAPVEGIGLILIKGTAPPGGLIEYTIDSLETAIEGPYTGLVIATVTVRVGDAVKGSTTEVVDHSRCIFDVETMTGYTGWAAWGDAWSLDVDDECETLTPKHWYAINRCCDSGSGLYSEPC